ncbi:MAG: hypothetical protein ACH350_04350 [Parachlamydiaceae bacterium]
MTLFLANGMNVKIGKFNPLSSSFLADVKAKEISKQMFTIGLIR